MAPIHHRPSAPSHLNKPCPVQPTLVAAEILSILAPAFKTHLVAPAVPASCAYGLNDALRAYRACASGLAGGGGSNGLANGSTDGPSGGGSGSYSYRGSSRRAREETASTAVIITPSGTDLCYGTG